MDHTVNAVYCLIGGHFDPTPEISGINSFKTCPSLAQYTVPTIATEIAVYQNCDISLANGISIFYKLWLF